VPIFTSPPVGVRSIAMSLSVCLSALISQNSHVQTSQNLPYVLPDSVAARSSADDSGIKGATTGGIGGSGPPNEFGRTTPNFLMKTAITVT